MKINNVEVKIIKGDIAKFKGHRRVMDQDYLNDEIKMRNFWARALRSASRRNLVAIIFSVRGGTKGAFPVVASAKIMAQEVFRHIREEKHCLKHIRIILDTPRPTNRTLQGADKDWPLGHSAQGTPDFSPGGLHSANMLRIFKNTAENYLKHIIHKLSQGPFITVDTIIEINGGIILIQRRNPPFGWALPGGFVDYGETLEEAAAREAKEETGLRVKNLKQMHTYSDPSRDPRFHTITTVFVCQAKGRPKAGSDAKDLGIFKPQDWKKLELVFDHRQVLEDYGLIKNLRPRCFS